MSQDNEVVADNESVSKYSFGLVGRKIGMSRIFEDDGTSIPVTIIDVAKNVVSDIRTVKKNGYDGIQVAFGAKKKSKVSKAVAGACGKKKIDVPQNQDYVIVVHVVELVHPIGLLFPYLFFLHLIHHF